MRFNGLSLVKYLQRICWVKGRYTKWVHIKSVSANAVVKHDETPECVEIDRRVETGVKFRVSRRYSRKKHMETGSFALR